MNKKELYQRMLELHSASPRNFRVHGYLRDEFPKLCAKLKSDFDVEQLGWEHVFRYCHPKVSGRCETCQKPTAFMADQRKFREYCSLSCMQNSPEVRAKKEATNLKRRGTRWPSQSKEVQGKVEATNLKRFGVKRPAQSEACQKKARKTNLHRYGVEHPMQNSDVRAKVVATNLEKSGGKYTTPFQEPKAMKKARKTMTERYGAPHTSQSPELKAKIADTMVERYGAANPSQVPELRQKVLATMMRNWGVEYLMQRPDLFKRSQKSSYKTYDFKIGGRTLQLQGYEDMAANSLLSIGVPKRSIKESTRSVRYTHKKKKGVYHPDFEIHHKGQSIVVEVKSEFTSGLQVSGKLLPEVLVKAKAVVQEGRPLLLLVMRTLKRDEVGYDRHAKRGTRKGRVTHYVFSTPKRPDWTIHSSKASKKELAQRLVAWLGS